MQHASLIRANHVQAPANYLHVRTNQPHSHASRPHTVVAFQPHTGVSGQQYPGQPYIQPYLQTSHLYSRSYRPAAYTAIFRGKPHIQPYLQISRPLQPLLQASHIAGQAYIYTAIFTDQPSVQPYLLASHIYSHIYRPAIFTGQAYIQPHIQAGHRPLHTQVLLASHTENRCTQAFQSTKSSCSCSIDCLSTGWLTRQQAHSLTDSPPQWGAADAEIKVPSGENTELKRSAFEAWSRSLYSQTCYVYCQEFLPCLFLPFRSIHLHFFEKHPRFFLRWLWLAPVPV